MVFITKLIFFFSVLILEKTIELIEKIIQNKKNKKKMEINAEIL